MVQSKQKLRPKTLTNWKKLLPKNAAEKIVTKKKQRKTKMDSNSGFVPEKYVSYAYKIFD